MFLIIIQSEKEKVKVGLTHMTYFKTVINRPQSCLGHPILVSRGTSTGVKSTVGVKFPSGLGGHEDRFTDN